MLGLVRREEWLSVVYFNYRFSVDAGKPDRTILKRLVLIVKCLPLLTETDNKTCLCVDVPYGVILAQKSRLSIQKVDVQKDFLHKARSKR